MLSMDDSLTQISLVHRIIKGVEHDLDRSYIVQADEYGTVHVCDTFLIRYNKANPSMATSMGFVELFVHLLFSFFVIGWVLYVTVKLFLVFAPSPASPSIRK